ncbi:MAG: biotin--[acetyl-CoA-carboxylase] ligase [Dehalococcoidia bacterium]|nr:biotin--[acetyl-CoA-carboxylase] ligase [Dehalococcoidia bacterium]
MQLPELTFPSTPRAILDALDRDGAFVSGETLAADLGLSRAAVSKAVARLRDLGYVIESSTRVGHRLVARPDRLIAPEVLHGLATGHFGHHVAHFESVPSTQPVARQLAEAGAPHGTLVVAEQQLAARGRLGRSYSSPRGGIWATVIVHGPLPAGRAPLVGLAAGVAAARAIMETTALPAVLKWPNDVFVNDRKVVGILTELASEEQAVHYLLVGSGINANFGREQLPAEVQDTASTLRHELGVEVPRVRLLQAYLREFEALFEQLRLDPAPVVDAWRALPNTIGRRIRAQLWEGDLQGIAAALLDDGALLVRTDSGDEVRITTGDVIHVPIASKETA